MPHHDGVPPRVRRLSFALPLLLSLLFAAGCSDAKPGTPLSPGHATGLPRSSASHVIVVVMENEEDTDVIGSRAAPYTNALAHRYALASESFAIRHPSLPNYLALTSGATQDVNSDCTDCHVAAANLVDQLEGAHITWKAYLEDQPAPCFAGASAGGYAKKHNPFIYYDDVARSPTRCRKLVGFAALQNDLRRGTLPTFVWISPNLCDDGHDCGLATADRFLARTVPLLLRELGPRGFLLLTWDEGSSDRGCCGGSARGGHIATILAGPRVREGAIDVSPIDHYGVLGSIEDALGLPPLGGAADLRSGRLRTLFRSPPHIRSP